MGAKTSVAESCYSFAMIHGMPLAASLPPASVGGQTQQSLLRFTLLDFVSLGREKRVPPASSVGARSQKGVCFDTGPTQMWTQRLSWPTSRAAAAHGTAFQTSYMNVQSLVQRPAKAVFTVVEIMDRRGNDPSAGSPTETLLRLHLPLNDKV